MAQIRVLNVAEKPSAARKIVDVLSLEGRNLVRTVNQHGVEVFEFNDFPFRNRLCTMVVTSVSGHLYQTEFDDSKFKRWNLHDPVDLFKAKIRKFVLPKNDKYEKTLKEKAVECDELFLWLDGNDEGEYIAWEVADVCASAKLGITVHRANFKALVDEDIKYAAQNPGVLNYNVIAAVDYRIEVDFKIGCSYSRFNTILFQAAFGPLNRSGKTLKFGTSLLPHLEFITNRYWDRIKHVPTKFWTLECTHTNDRGKITRFEYSRVHLHGRMPNHALATARLGEYQQQTATVLEPCNKSLRHVEPPSPLNTLELLKCASDYYGMSSALTMDVAEELYKLDVISYPRTPATSFDRIATDLPRLVGAQQWDPQWGVYAQNLLADPTPMLLQGGVPQSNQGEVEDLPIYPTRYHDGLGWSTDFKRVYGIVVRYFLASLSRTVWIRQSTAVLGMTNETLYARGEEVRGYFSYFDIFPFTSWKKSEIPKYYTGQMLTPIWALVPGTTEPPPLLSESELLDYMIKEGTGTDSTMHIHVEKCLDGYATRDVNMLLTPTDLGQALVKGYHDMGYKLKQANLDMEKDMQDIRTQTRRKADVLKDCLEQAETSYKEVTENRMALIQAGETFLGKKSNCVRRCSTCDESEMVLQTRDGGNFEVACARANCKGVVKLPSCIETATVTDQVCEFCVPRKVFKIRFKFREGEIPRIYRSMHVGCIVCDRLINQLKNLCGFGRSNGWTREDSPSGMVYCVKCKQSGHVFSECTQPAM